MTTGRAGLLDRVPANPLIAAANFGGVVNWIDRLHRVAHNQDVDPRARLVPPKRKPADYGETHEPGATRF